MRDTSLAQSKILIIDDEDEVVELLRRVLKVGGYREIVSTTDPLDAIRLFAEFQPDLVVLDLLMPGMCGWKVLAALRAIIPEENYLPILVVTGDPNIESRRAALSSGASDFVAKPYDNLELLARVANLLETRNLGRKKAAEAGRESEERFSGAFEHAPIGVALVAPDGRWLKVNRALCALVGYSEAELLALTFQDITHPEDLEADLDNVRGMLAGEICSYQMEKRYLHHRGHVVAVLLNVSLVRDSRGQPSYFISQIQDITERRRAETALLESKRFLQSTLDALSSHIAILDEGGTIVEVNRAWTRSVCQNELMGGYGGVGANYLQLCDSVSGSFSAEASAVAQGIRGVMAGRNEEFHLEYPCPSGEEQHWFIVRATRFDGDGPVRVVVAHENITERKRAEEALRKEQEFLAVLVENVSDGIVSCDADGVITLFNRATRELHGLPAEPISAERWAEHFDIFLPDGETRCPLNQIPLFRALHEGSVRAAEMVIAPRDGPARLVLASGQALCDPRGVKVGAVVVMHDITEQRRAQESIRVQAQMLDHIGQAVIATDLSGEIMYANRFAQHLYGWSPAEVLQRNILEVAVSSTGREQMEQIMARLQRGENWSGESLVRHRDGTEFPVFVTSTPLRNQQGDLIGIVGISEDITERKQTEAAMRQRDALLCNAQRVGGMGVWELDVVRNHLNWSEETHRIFGVTGAAFGNNFESFFALVHPGDLERMKALYAQPPANAAAVEAEYRIRRPDGEERVLFERGEVTLDAEGRPLRKIGVVMDITERKRAQKELFQSRETLRQILDHIPQRVFWKDRELVYRGCNQAFASDMGFADSSAVIGLTDYDANWKDFAEAYRADDRSVIDRDATKSSFEEPGIGLDGRRLWLRTSKVPLHDSEGRVTGLLGTYEDVTEYKLAKLEIERLNAELEQRVAQRTADLLAVTQEAGRANRAKSEFLSRTSHELRTPLNSILGFGQLLEMEENLGPEPRESVEQILNAGRHLLTLIDEVLDISNAESGRMSLSLEPVAVEPLLDETLCLVRPLGAALQVQLELQPSFDRHCRVLADRQRLKQVLLNLFSNAVKYNRPGGKVFLECALAEAAGRPAFRFCVRDTGPGISADKLPRLFTPFDRLDAERTRTHIVGTGLGLALSKRMVELMDGRIGAESVLGEGSTFWVEIPLADSALGGADENARPAELESKPDSPSTSTVLYIEDNAANLRLLTRILARRPAIELLSAETGALGLKLAREQRPDLIVLDLHLPDYNGDQLLARLRADPCTSEIPVIIVTADDQPEKREQLLLSGARAFVTKPVEVRTFLGLLDQFLGSACSVGQ